MTIDARFEKISKYAEDVGVIIPTRKTTGSAGYDFYAAEDTILPPFTEKVENALIADIVKRNKENPDLKITNVNTYMEQEYPYSLERVAEITKQYSTKVSLVPTGIKCYIPDGYYLQLSPRSSLPLKHWIIMANGVGIIDSDYYNNSDNEGHIYFQLINLLPVPVVIKRGECFGQGILLPYGVCAEENKVVETREGGFGSTDE